MQGRSDGQEDVEIVRASVAVADGDRDAARTAHDGEPVAGAVAFDAFRNVADERIERRHHDPVLQTRRPRGGYLTAVDHDRHGTCIDHRLFRSAACFPIRAISKGAKAGTSAAAPWLRRGGAGALCGKNDGSPNARAEMAVRGTKTLIRALAFWIVVALAGAVPLGTPASDLFPEPVVVVYPFTVSGSSGGSAVGSNIALLLATRLGELGGLTVKPFTPGTVRADYLTAARGENADYYVTGFLAPIGSEVSLITQVVTTTSGLVVWSSTTTIRTYGDANAQADPLHQAILAHAGRALSAIPVQSAAATPQPATSDAASFNVTRALGRHRKASAVASATPSPAAAVALQTSASPVVTAAGVVTAAATASAPAAALPVAAARRARPSPIASASPSPVAAVAVTAVPLPPPARHHGKTAAALAVASPSAPPNAASASAPTTAGPTKAEPATAASPKAGSTMSGPSSAAGAAVPAAGKAVAVASTGSQGAPGALITYVGGTTDAATRDYTGSALAGALRRAGVTRGGNVPIEGSDAVIHAADLCRANAGTQTLYVPTVAVSGTTGRRSVSVDVDAYDCAGKAIGTQHDVETAWGRRGLERAIDKAAQKAIDAFVRAAASPQPSSES